MLRALPLALLASLALPASAATRNAPLKVPTGSVTGSLRASWTEISRADPMTRTDATITFTIEDRLRSPGAAEAWVTEPIPDFARGVLRSSYAYLLRARVSVDAFTRTVDNVCDDGSTARTTTTVSSVNRPQGLLQLPEDPVVNLLAHAGTTELGLVDVVQGDAPDIREAVVGMGVVTARTTGADCSGVDEDGQSVPKAVDTSAQVPLATLAGGGAVAAIVVDANDAPLRVLAGGAIAMDHASPLFYQGTSPETDTFTGTWSPNVRLAGPLRSQRAQCRLPTARRLSRVHTVRGARRLLRRYGIPDVVYGGPRRHAGRARTFFLKKGTTAYAFCGATLGTRGAPRLYSVALR